MKNKEIIIDGVDVAKCRYFTSEWDFNNCGHICKEAECKYKRLWYKKQLKRKEQECEELKERTASIIYSLTGGRLSYSTYTLEGCEQAYHDQLEIDVERATKELEEKLQAKEQECEELKHKVELMMDCASCKIDEYKQTLIEIIRFFKEDEKFARYSGRPIIFAKPALEKIEKILKENNIKIS